ncbi:hypothetical protein RRG08_006541 [Elysia crispata]|uniref:Uncharacterized protein n=1 Tax=Elysia crispata TaxID=231223 RepID=A0AAE1ATH9_9GAST|nr:hypothetical protein RRG08_006541 [Elysia crispata]
MKREKSGDRKRSNKWKFDGARSELWSECVERFGARSNFTHRQLPQKKEPGDNRADCVKRSSRPNTPRIPQCLIRQSVQSAELGLAIMMYRFDH